MAFRTEDELKTHLEIEHKKNQNKIRADGLLNFEYGKDENKKPKKPQKFEIKDSEGVDFSYYFSEKYNFINDKRRKDFHKGQNYRGEQQSNR